LRERSHDVERLIVFVRLPATGRVKTRLAKVVGPENAAALYRCFVADVLATVRRSGYPPLVFFDPPDDGARVKEWLGEEMTCLPQTGEELGKRMAEAFKVAFASCSRAVLLGSDCPDLPEALIAEAFRSLENHDAVIGPAVDGGYLLIGFVKAGFSEAAFEGIEWGGAQVFDTTLAILQQNHVNLHVLPAWNDIDDYADLKALFGRQKDAPPGRLATVDFLRGHLHW
jgi:uncharacterized protein